MRRADATRLYYGLEFFLSLPTWIVISVYLVRDLHLSPLALVLVGTAMEAAVFTFEVPTGIVADTYSRRLSLIIGFVGMGVAWVLVGSAAAAWAVIAAWGFWGVAYTFTSGAYQAWITDEVGVDKVGLVFLRGARWSYAGSFVGLGASVALGTQSLRAAVIAGGLVQIACGLACVVLMPETGFTRRPREQRGSAFAELRTTGRAGGRYVRAQPLLLLILGIAFFAGMSSEAFDRLKDAHFLRDIGLPGSIDPIVWFGALGLVPMIFGFFLVGRMIKRFERVGTAGVVSLLLALTTVLMVAQLTFALTGALALAAAAVLVSSVARQLIGPLKNTWINEQISDSSVRATVLSITGQSDAIGQTLGGPALGVIGNVWGIRAALTTGALILAPALGLYGRALGHGGREPELEELPQPSMS
jgi:DHA3 family tetracycline resistance protein-like MFS transporter